MTRQGQGISIVERGIDSESIWFSEGSTLVHNRIAGSIQGCPWIDSSSQRGAQGEHPWIVCPRKTVKTPPRYGCRAPYDVDELHRLIDVEVNKGELSNHVERSDVHRLGPDLGLSEPYAVLGDPYIDPWVSEAIRLEC
jgi:hypothetical protein